MPQRTKRRRFSARKFVLNCVESVGQEDDWTLGDAIEAGFVDESRRVPSRRDLREPWWPVRDQGSTGACVGFATADGVLRWTYANAGLTKQGDQPAPRFIWMANKETDGITSYPTTFIESAGTQTKRALRVAQKFGCVMEPDLPMNGGLANLSTAAFYGRAAKFRITSYHNLRRDLDTWRRWIGLQGPILTRLNVDRTWDRATHTDGKLDQYLEDTARGGHAVCLVGYTPDHFIVRNSWGKSWGDDGFGYASNEYAEAAFTEAYGAVL